MLNALALSIFDCLHSFKGYVLFGLILKTFARKCFGKPYRVCFARFVCGRESDFLSADEIIDAHVKIVRKFPKAFD